MYFSKIETEIIDPIDNLGDLLKNKLQLSFSGEAAETNNNPTEKGTTTTRALPKTEY